jgi:4'-phosphopantetheinyl transferase
MDKKPLHLWCACPDDLLVEGIAEACAALLSAEESDRWQRFRLERLRRESLTTRALVRTALSHYHPLPPEAWRFKSNAHGKPAAEPECGLRFNLSNSGGLVVCLIAEGAEVGVDVEPYARAAQVLGLAPEVFSVHEMAQLRGLGDAEQRDRALSLWTLKEAYIKARGLGLSLPLQQFAFVFGGAEGIRLEIDPRLGDEARNWRFCLLDHAGHRIAVMVERAGAGALEMWEARPVLAPPRRIHTGGGPWYPRSRGIFTSAIS